MPHMQPTGTAKSAASPTRRAPIRPGPWVAATSVMSSPCGVPYETCAVEIQSTLKAENAKLPPERREDYIAPFQARMTRFQYLANRLAKVKAEAALADLPDTPARARYIFARSTQLTLRDLTRAASVGMSSLPGNCGASAASARP